MGKELVSLKMTMEIFDLGSKDVSIIEEQGQLQKKGDLTVLTFTENKGKENETRSMVTMKSDEISVKRSGAVSMIQKFKKKETTENVYRHPYGMIHMKTMTDQLQVDLDKGSIFISYKTNLNGGNSRRHRLTIRFQRNSNE
ncbi:uncharacterized beta-barrel protein YwiB (DUF1934 family) [Gracilibacillus halotolerans]|uniref:Uncharacterized beta-barrel protein YwiB (DUF1934 family) n=1 Tax=Gracilibacillus halotolerans TaxID=74386 RepID=A0A841RQ72_9BACI|nr:DUF1934 domain-containing protein [Gracilibacillus halotolerans]MBB6513074.1 uncharacterized beta-barrel protein YwiB (DUF1934 family) [Gracilibacillus halotolerans]